MEDEHSLGTEQSLAKAALPETVSHQVPRPRISHLLLWTLCSAVSLTMQRYWWSSVELSDTYDSVLAISGSIEGIVNGATLTGTIILFLAYLKDGPPLFKEPGHWLIVAHAVKSFLEWFPSWKLVLLGGMSGSALQSILCCVLVALIAIYVLAYRQCIQLRWKQFFAALVLLTLVKLIANVILLTDLFDFGVFHWMHLAYSLGDIILCVWTLVVLIIDKKGRIHRDWLHWTGVVMFLVSQCQYLIRTIAGSLL